jgi:nitrate reductase NapAB chaperone NapD
MEQAKKWIIFSVALVFVAGFLAGALAGMTVERKGILSGGRTPMTDPGQMRPPHREQMRENFARMLKEELSLSDAQSAQLLVIMENNEQEMIKHRDEMWNSIQDMRKKISSQIQETLNEEQKKKFAELEERMARDFESRVRGPMGEGGEGGFAPPKPHRGMGPRDGGEPFPGGPPPQESFDRDGGGK